MSTMFEALQLAMPSTAMRDESAPLPVIPLREPVQVAYQRIFFDWDLADGPYTPEQLRKAKVAVKPWGAVQSYRLAGESDVGASQHRGE